MPETEQMLPPPVLWAQRKSVVFLTICLEDCKDPIIKLETDKLYFKGKGGSDQKDYEVTLDFFQDVNTEESKFVARDRLIEFVLRKKDDGPYWKRLLKDDKKFHWVKVDFNKWRDEDDSDDDAEGNADLEEMMRQMGGLGGGGGGGDKPNLVDLEAGEEEDSDDEELPELE